MPEQIYSFDGLTVNCDSEEVSRSDGFTVLGRGIKFDLLVYLIENRTGWVSNADLKKDVWQTGSVENNTIHQAVRHLRRLLGCSGINRYKYIATYPRKGYKFVYHISDDEPLDEDEDNSPRKTHAKYIYFTSFMFGALFFLAMWVVTCDGVEGNKSLITGWGIFLWALNSVVALIAMKLTRLLTDKNWPNAPALVGLSLFILVPAILSPLVASYFLPSRPINTFQSLPADAFFALNCVYLMLLGVVAIFAPYYYRLLQLRRFADPEHTIRFFWHKGRDFFHPKLLFRLWQVSLVLHAIFYFLIILPDVNGPHLTLYILLTAGRAIMYFGLGLYCVAWFYTVRGRSIY